MSNLFAGNANVTDSTFVAIGRDQLNQSTHITYSSPQDSLSAALKPVDRSGYYVPPCMRGTRHWVIEQIHTWINDSEMPNILWLSGSPGVGKSTIASTLVSRLLEMGKLGSHFFFKRDDVTLSDPAALWRTVAFDVAQTDSVFAKRLLGNLHKVDATRPDIESHFKHLISNPLSESLKEDMTHTTKVCSDFVKHDCVS